MASNGHARGRSPALGTSFAGGRYTSRVPSGSHLRNILVGLAATGLVTLVGHRLALNAISIALLLLTTVLGLAVSNGLAAALAGSLAATLLFNYFFLPPFGTLSISEPANWVALGCFLVAAVVGSQLIARARAQAERAERRQREVQMLYDLCFRLFTARPDSSGLRDVLAQGFALLEARGGTLHLERDGIETLALDAPITAEEPPERGARRDVTRPILLGATVRGELVLRQTTASDRVVESAGRLIALAVERERLLEEAAHTEALRQSDALKTALLRAVSHDLRSPLTAMALGLERARREAAGIGQLPETLARVEAERERLARRIDNLLTLARLEAGLARPRPEPVPAAEILRAAREALHFSVQGRRVETTVAADCPELDVDAALTVEIVVNLLDNALRATDPETMIELAALSDPADPMRVMLAVRDRGPGLPSGADGFGVAAGGLGLEIASSLARAHGGELRLAQRPGGGTEASVVLPAAAHPTPAEHTARAALEGVS